jgi:hypothetical protein
MEISKRKTPETLENPWVSGAISMEQDTGIEPAYSAWEADILPLN